MTHIARLKGAPKCPLPRLYDVDAGSGEAWPALLAQIPKAQITALTTAAPQPSAAKRATRYRAGQIRIEIGDDPFTAPLPEGAADLLHCVTRHALDPSEQRDLAALITAALAPGAAYALVCPRPIRPLTEALRAEGLFVAERTHLLGQACSVAGFKPVAPPEQTH